MKVVIVGAGAVGLLLACILDEAGAAVQVLARQKQQARIINEQGIIKDGHRHNVPAFTEWTEIPSDAFILLAVKYDALDELVPALKRYAPYNPVVFLQNGMLHLRVAEGLPHGDIAAASVEHGALKISGNEVRHTGNGTVKWALLKGRQQKFLPFTKLEGFRAEWHEDADRLLFRKVLLNGIINPLTAITALKNGELVTNPYAFELMQRVYAELDRAFPEIKTLLPFEEVTALCKATAENKSSMLMDRQAGRKMELDTIVLYLLERSPIELPLLKAFYQLLKSIEV
ncbi:2-dehydropantoate 2-reductase [Planococcus sp. N064]|uniref:2-dehydropantoate 2-reductase n=1 Tax=Planococcus liqunii TaxID=3058394 RepID=A0ABT8MMD4_9BACL|nr:2-dehydropantoate 2-reductase [Planococcus sp. N064]MDN7226047.1 2-dehydropantoate 2-reductase [Planococcus sp. N064]